MTAQLERKVVVTGGHGFLGAAIVRHLLAAGWRVRLIARKSAELQRIRGLEVELVEGDIRDRATVSAAAAGCDAVVHAAAATGVGRNWDDCRSINIDGTRNVIAACRAGGVRSLVHISSAAVYGLAPGIYREDSPRRREGDPYGDTKITAEELCEEAAHALSVSIVRPTLIVGEGDNGFFPMFLDMLAKRRFPLFRGGHAAARLVAVDDSARLAVRCLAQDAPSGESYNSCAPGRLSWRAFADQIADARALPRPKMSMPAGPMYAVASVAGAVAKLGINVPLTRTMVAFLAEERAYPVDKAQATLGFLHTHAAEGCVALALASAPPLVAAAA